ncbi:hypothetical protein [Gracilibacillus saliphilus]|uniref:hypothetical protein n=1 Tax=Gracilibacillus saliphilus TaxID=543890 RepID=UPI0013CF93DB|nr:hypothetical protein [Gracilibacillus saliphilus]
MKKGWKEVDGLPQKGEYVYLRFIDQIEKIESGYEMRSAAEQIAEGIAVKVEEE